MIDYSKYNTRKAEPEASSMIETFRAIGYSIEAAISDIIDNSITAKAKNIWIDYTWKGSKTILSIIDDGYGMDEEELVQAMKPGSKNPLDERETKDLGRFGLGLKTASFSQTRKLTVFSKTVLSQPVFWTWDLNYVNYVQDWQLIKYVTDEEYWVSKFNNLSSGTCVIWWELDRLAQDTHEDSEEAKKKFLFIMDKVKYHLSMVFHRFIEEGLNIYFRNRLIEPWNPFFFGADGLQTKPEVKLDGGQVKIKGFILPHRSKLSVDEYDHGKGPKDSWTAHQGFYVYRNKRLLVAGDWLGLFKREVHYDLCRIRIDLANTVDESWQIDIKKSVARPPTLYRDQLVAVAKETRNQAVEVYRHKGKVLKRKLLKEEFSQIWEERVRHGKRFYKINRNHPIIQGLYNDLVDQKSIVEQTIKFIEETVPIPLITLQENENEKPHGQPFEGVDHMAIKETMQKLYKNFLNDGITEDRAKAKVLNIEPFNFYPEYIEFIDYD